MWDVFDPDELAVKGKLDEQKINGRPKEFKNQDQQKAPIMKIGMSSIYLTGCWRDPDSDACYICGQDGHCEQFCPYNYIYGLYGLYDQDTCRADCLPGQHTMAMACRNLLQSFIRVNNMPSRFCTWDLRKLLEPFGPLLMWYVPMGSSEVRRGYGVAIFKDHGDGERAIETLNGYLVGKSKLRVDWAYAMPPGGRPREKCKISTTKRVFKRRPPLQGVLTANHSRLVFIQRVPVSYSIYAFLTQRCFQGPGNSELLVFSYPSFGGSTPPVIHSLLRRRQSKNTVLINEAGEKRKEMNVESSGAIKTRWRDPGAKFCWIRRDEEPGHEELTCPYTTTYRRPHTLPAGHDCSSGNTKPIAHVRPKDLDATSLRRLKFLRCFVRVNNLPRRPRPEELVGLFTRFGPLRSWYVAFDDHGSGACSSGFGYVVFRRLAHAKEAIDVLNCCIFGGRKLRVD